MCKFQTDNITFIIGIMTVDQYSLGCCSSALTSTLSKYLSDKLCHYTNCNFVFRLRLAVISLFVTYCIHVSSSGGRESSILYNRYGLT